MSRAPMSTEEPATFTRCSTCKTPIPFGASYYRCSVSTCNAKRFTLRFCSVPCWDAHQAEANHRDAWAEEDRAPSRAVHEEQQRAQQAERERRAASPEAPEIREARGKAAHEVLVVSTKVKAYVKDRAKMSVSDKVMGVLSDHLRDLSRVAIERSGKDGRKTVMDRDVSPLIARESTLASGEGVEETGAKEALVIVSKLKRHIKTVSGMNTSDNVVPVLSDHLRVLLRRAIRHAGGDDRRTLLDRDLVAVLRDFEASGR